MSPKEQATSIKLLVRWLELGRTLTTEDPATFEQVFAAQKKLEELQVDTQAFIDHEDDT